MRRGACTIVSLNYLPYARTLCASYQKYNPGHDFFVLLVDRVPADIDLSREDFQLVLVDDLAIPNFESVAFKYDILELNTAVKPTFLKELLGRGVEELIYLDPDILLCSPADVIFEGLATHAIVVTPHCLTPNEGSPAGEAILLYSGVFNLGFVAVSKSEEALRFLSWWEQRCLTLGYVDRQNGLFVDQKWIDFVPCYFDSVLILKHPGCNMAYWNLYERHLERVGDRWMVNGREPLIFYHFSGGNVDGGDTISKGYDQFDLTSRPDLRELFAGYRAQLIHNGIRDVSRHKYAFGSYSNGQFINKLQRSLYSSNLDGFASGSPFDAQGPFYRWAARKHLHDRKESAAQHNRRTIDRTDPRVRIVNSMLRLALRLLGADRYTVLMKYLAYISVLRNQKDIFVEAPLNSFEASVQRGSE
jgi:hypothetical protein